MLPSTLHHRLARKRRIRARVRGTAGRPRLSVYRSLTNLYAQLVDDDTGRTLVAGSLKEAKAKLTVDGAKKLGALVAKKARTKKIGKVVFDRNAYKYHGRVKALAEGAREGGLQF